MQSTIETLLHKCGTNYYSFLYYLAREIKPALSIELGTWEGKSAAMLKNGWPDGRVVSYDILNCVREPYKLSGVEYVVKDSVLGANDVEDGSVDIIFIDSEHNGVQPLLEFNAWKRKVKKSAIVLFDDVYINNEMIEFWDNLKPEGFKKINTRLHINEGFGVLVCF